MDGRRQTYGPSKKVFIMVFFTTSRISLKRRGMTPDPGNPQTSSKSIWIASQFVMPPANPNKPAARTHFARPETGCRDARQARPGCCQPRATQRNVTRGEARVAKWAGVGWVQVAGACRERGGRQGHTEQQHGRTPSSPCVGPSSSEDALRNTPTSMMQNVARLLSEPGQCGNF